MVMAWLQRLIGALRGRTLRRSLLLLCALLAVVRLDRAVHPRLPQADEPAPRRARSNDMRSLSDLRFSDLDGRPLGLDAFKGKIVLLNYWATWCAPCRAEFPALDRLQAAWADRGLVVVPVSIDHGGRTPVEAFFARLGLVHLVPYLDPQGNGPAHLGLRGVPTTLLIDREGRQVALFEGSTDWDGATIRAALQAIPGPK